MSDLISRSALYVKVAELEELARNRVLDTPTNSPCYQRYVSQLNERTALKHLIADFPTAYNPDKVVENATNVCNINPETPLENVVADCMTDYLEMRKAKDEGLLLRLPCKVGGKVYVIAPNYNKCENHYECEEYDSEQYLITWCQANCPKGFKGIGVVETKVVEIKIREGDIYLQTDRCGLRNTKNMFLTKEEAEQALKQMKGE